MIGDLLVGIGGLLATSDLGTWDDGTTTTGTGPLVTVQDVPDKPNSIIALSGYPVQDDPTTNDSVVGTQLRFRGEPNDRQTLQTASDAVFNLLQGLTGQTVNGVHVTAVWRQGGGWVGRDDNLRWERADLYYWRIAWPTTHRPD